jgi:hypothetical protein
LNRDQTVGDELLNITEETGSAPLHARLEILLDIDVGGVLAEDVLITPGTQAYIKGAGR